MGNSVNFYADGNYDLFQKFASGEVDSDDAYELADAEGVKPRILDLMGSISRQLKPLESEVDTMIADLQKNIADAEDPSVRMDLRDALSDLKTAWRDVTHNPPGMHRNPSEFQDLWNNRMSEVRNAISSANRANIQAGGPEEAKATAMMVSNPVAEPVAMEVPGAEASSESGKTDSATTAEKAEEGMQLSEWAQQSDDKLLDQMTKDREGFWDQMGELGFEEQQFVMNKVQTRMQQINRMFSTMSNITKSMHDTAKAAINNMRV